MFFGITLATTVSRNASDGAAASQGQCCQPGQRQCLDGHVLRAGALAEGDPLAFFPPTYYSDLISSSRAENRGKTMTMEELLPFSFKTEILG